ncbi:uracil phosphoribosyltransferase [Algoriphagus halophytocola]|uniref:Uracil phosphoribosyltransferase n=1 Tax=Algoriphagus halophytocola TaxID=2991499 RepID=A0ABY6MDJ3_9BACT|nr:MULTISPECIES: uracil phosphoribosyltransferase [unclassified Algoriphagus]UZD20954.1 uracil phosphoribosyltransferase [Algoriphagus sp. TR-M5]WBL42120.1 uracil phosphoribosyltransferase [Algoriphagus sp. TR-M9]
MFVLSDTPSLAHQFLLELRDIHIQKDSMRFRRNLERLGEILAYEISKSLNFNSLPIETPIQASTVLQPSEQPVIISVMRAALPFYHGFLNYFDRADSGFIGAFRDESKEGEIAIELGYHASPSIEERTVILADPMLATGKSIVETVNTLLAHGKPKHLHIASVIAAPEGIQYLKENLNCSFSLWLGAIDEKLNHQSYIVPGLGDAGDLAFGPKL